MDERPTPNFFIVGAPKAGTTALYSSLAQHPAVYMSPIKEPCFFAPEVADFTPRARELFEGDAADLQTYLDGPMRDPRDHGIVLEWAQYLKLFRHVRHETAIGEASVAYLGSLDAPRAIRARIADARIIMLLRDPADRLFSHYAAAHAAGATDLTFVDWANEQVAIEAARGRPLGPVWAGRYAVHLQRYLEHFPSTHVRVHLYDDYLRAPSTVARDLLAFIGVDPTWPIDVERRHNVTTVPRWPAMHRLLIRPIRRATRGIVPAPMAHRLRTWARTPLRGGPAPQARARIIGMYEEDIRVLEKLIQRDLSAWLDPERPTHAAEQRPDGLDGPAEGGAHRKHGTR